MSTFWTAVLPALIVAVVGGIGVAIVTHFLNRRKVNAETEKTLAEAEKIRMEIKQPSASGGVPSERIVFDGRAAVTGFDITGRDGRLWNPDGTARSGFGHGSIEFHPGGVIHVSRTNAEGRYELWFERYTFDGKEYDHIPANPLVAGERKLRITCEAKAIGAQHTLRFVVRNAIGGHPLYHVEKTVGANEWTPIDAYLRVDPTTKTQLRIDDEATSAPTSVQIRNLLVVERV